MSKKLTGLICLGVYSLILVFSSFFIGRTTSDANTNDVITTDITEVEEESYTAKEKDGKLAVFKDGELLMSLDTNVEVLPGVVRSQLKKGINFKPSDLPGILEAFAE